MPASIPTFLGTLILDTTPVSTVLVCRRLVLIGVMVPLQFGTMFRLCNR